MYFINYLKHYWRKTDYQSVIIIISDPGIVALVHYRVPVLMLSNMTIALTVQYTGSCSFVAAMAVSKCIDSACL